MQHAMDPIQEAINRISPKTLRILVLQMCKENSECRKVLESLLLVNTSSIHSLKKRKRDNSDSQDNGSILVQRFQVCTQCDEELDISKNEEGSCIYHDGEKEIDDDSSVWDDYEDWREGPVEDKLNNPDFADGYVWTCCNKRGDEGGCKTSSHNFKQADIITANITALIEEGISLPATKYQKIDGSPLISVPSFVAPTGHMPVSKSSKISTTPITVLSDSSDEKGEFGQEHIFECRTCGEVYSKEEYDKCITHEGASRIKPDCPLSEEEQQNLRRGKNPEQFI